MALLVPNCWWGFCSTAVDLDSSWITSCWGVYQQGSLLLTPKAGLGLLWSLLVLC